MPKSNYSDPMRMVRLASAACIVERYTGDRPSASTLYRWHQRGVAGVKLQARWAAGSLRTTDEWIQRFFADVTAAKSGQVTASVPSRDRQRAIDRANAELAKDGF